MQTGPISSMSGEVNKLFYFLLGLCTFTAALIFALLVIFSVKFRRKPGYTKPQPVKRKRFLIEIFTLGVPFITFLFIFAWSAKIYFEQMKVPGNTIQLYTVAQQWMWKFQHREGIREINDLHVPIGRPVSLTMTSQDVIHSFFVPSFRVKMDVVPGRYTTVWFNVKRPGTYRLFCSQYCGTWHSRMTGFVVAMKPKDYQNWLLKSRTQRMSEKGRKIFEAHGCMQCHGAHSHVSAPDLHGLFGSPVHLANGQVLKADENFIHDAVFYPGRHLVEGYANIMPTFKNQLSEEDVNDLIEYIKSLSSGYKD